MKVFSSACMIILFVGWGISGVQAGNFNDKDVKGTYSFFLNATGSLAASNSTATAQSINRVGVMEADGKGALTGRTITVVDDGSAIVTIDYKWTGSYTVDNDGTGTITIDAPSPSDIKSCRDSQGGLVGGCEQALGVEHFAFVIVAGKKESTLSLIQTDAPLTDSRLFLRGTATTQEVKKGGGGGGFSLF